MGSDNSEIMWLVKSDGNTGPSVWFVHIFSKNSDDTEEYDVDDSFCTSYCSEYLNNKKAAVH